MEDSGIGAFVSSVPDGFVAVCADEAWAGSAVRPSLVVRSQDDPTAGRLVELRAEPHACSFLGCVTDAAGVVHQWLEIWVQRPDRLCGAPSAYRDAWNNGALDRAWDQWVEAVSRRDPISIVRTGLEEAGARASFLDLATGGLVHPQVQGTSHFLRVCADESVLEEVGLPAYASTRSRYLWAPELGLESPFVPATSDSPETGPTASLEAIMGEARELAPINPSGGRILLRRLAPLSLEDLLDVLGGAAWNGISDGRMAVPVCGRPRSGTTMEDGGGLFLGRQGKRGRIVEALHLKLGALASSVEQVSGLIERTQRPLLGLNASSFGVEPPPDQPGLPNLWATRIVLRDPGAAVEAPMKGTGGKLFLASDPEAPGVYRPRLETAGGRGTGGFRVRRLLESDQSAIIEGTLWSDEGIVASASDLAWLSPTIGGERVDVYARLERDKALAPGEWRVRSLEHRFDAKTVAAIKAIEGVRIERTPFEIVPVLSSPCDLYALGVLGVRSLLVNPQTTLAIALDEALSLARQVGEGDPQEPLEARIAGAFDADERWLHSLGPNRLIREEVTPEEALGVVPREVWFEVLALLITMFSGACRDATCRDLGDARSGGLHAVFEPARRRLELLRVRTRSLLVIDWHYNREVSGVIRHLMTGLAPARVRAKA
ncbi:MAG: hypothetical protein H6811_06310 [Phycisphaeraceae bacterium]|nr:hypothetical protein [Phycisphaeraceae bacterium]